jgi:signal transduction histidine kinase
MADERSPATDDAPETARLRLELARREQELSRLSQELDETNRGVVALYSELDEKAHSLRRANELKSRFLSNMSHEFRTPLSSIINLAHLLLERADGELTPEQERQVIYIRRAADSLMEMVNDLLDLARIEAGKIPVRKSRFGVDELFSALRGMFRPLLKSDAVALTFEAAPDLPALDTDEGKLSQILRNLISNALKFTERGEVRVSAAHGDPGEIVFRVRDTGVGIAPGDLQRIFDEFSQVDAPIQRRHKGTGLGLPLSRRLAEILGGALLVESAVGEGSCFTARLPAAYPGGAEAGDDGSLLKPADPR